MKQYPKTRWVNIMYFALPLKYNEHGYLEPDRLAERTLIKSYDFPYEVWRRRMNFFNLRLYQLQLANMDKRIEIAYSHYVRSKGEEDLRRNLSIASAKGQVTKIRNAMEQYKQQRKKELFWEPENDPYWQKALVKLEQKKAKLRELVKQDRKKITN